MTRFYLECMRIKHKMVSGCREAQGSGADDKRRTMEPGGRVDYGGWRCFTDRKPCPSSTTTSCPLATTRMRTRLATAANTRLPSGPDSRGTVHEYGGPNVACWVCPHFRQDTTATYSADWIGDHGDRQ